MRFEKFIPTDRLKPYIKHFIVSEKDLGTAYKIFPSAGLVMGFQYKGQLSIIKEAKPETLSSAGVTGISGSYKIFKDEGNIGTVLVVFTETGFSHFASHPANELFNLSISLDTIFDKNKVTEVEEKLAISTADTQRIKIVERFLLSRLKDIKADKLIIEGVRLIYESKGMIRIKDLNEKLYTSASPFEKRFRRIVGTSPKKFASIVRFNSILQNLHSPKSLTEICYENSFFDQAHFIKDFKQFTGDTPENFKRFM